MTDDKIIKPQFGPKPREAVVTHGVPTETPDAGHPSDDMLDLVNVRPAVQGMSAVELYQHSMDYQRAIEAVDRAAAAYRTALFALAKVLDRNGGGDDGDAA